MQPISLKQLITITPLNKQTKQKTLDRLPSLTESQKFDIARQCWKAISLSYQIMVKDKFDQMFEEMTQGKAVYQKEDFDNAEKEIFNKFLVKVDETQSLEEVESLKQSLKNPDSPPPVE